MNKLIFSGSILPVVFFLISCGNSGNKSGSETSPPALKAENRAATSETPVSITRKYGIKSGIVTFESVGMGINQKVILYFDDFGAREAEEKYGLDNNIMETALCDGTNRYTLVYKDKSVINNGACPRGVAYRFDWNEVSKADPKYKPQKLSDISIAGKNCESFSLETSGNTVIYAGWNNICFLIDQNTQFGKMTYKAIAFEENVSVPEEKLKVPAGFQIK